MNAAMRGSLSRRPKGARGNPLIEGARSGLVYLFREEGHTAGRKRSSVVFITIGRSPYAIVHGCLDRTQNQLLHYFRALGIGGRAAPGNCPAPDDHVQLAKWCLLSSINKPRHAYRGIRGLQDAPFRRPVLFDRSAQLIVALENAFGGELVQQGSDGALHDVLFFRATRGCPRGEGIVRLVHMSGVGIDGADWRKGRQDNYQRERYSKTDQN